MDNKKIFEIIDKFNASGLTELCIKDGEFEISIGKEAANAVTQPSEQPKTVTEQPKEQSQEQPKEQLKTVKSPIVGTYYSAASPEKPDFVTVGSRVSKGDTVCIIEAMKMFNEVSCEFDGVVKEILVENGANIEYGQPLIILE